MLFQKIQFFQNIFKFKPDQRRLAWEGVGDRWSSSRRSGWSWWVKATAAETDQLTLEALKGVAVVDVVVVRGKFSSSDFSPGWPRRCSR